MQVQTASNEEKKDLFKITHAFQPIKRMNVPKKANEKLDISSFLEQSIEKYLGQSDNNAVKEEEKKVKKSENNVIKFPYTLNSSHFLILLFMRKFVLDADSYD